MVEEEDNFVDEIIVGFISKTILKVRRNEKRRKRKQTRGSKIHEKVFQCTPLAYSISQGKRNGFSWFENLKQMGDVWFYRSYHLTLPFFAQLVHLLSPFLEFHRHREITAEQICAIGLIRLTQGLSLSFLCTLIPFQYQTIVRASNRFINGVLLLNDQLKLVKFPFFKDEIICEAKNWEATNPHFKGVLGLIDGTHIPLMLRSTKEKSYSLNERDAWRSRKGFTSTNILVSVIISIKKILIIFI